MDGLLKEVQYLKGVGPRRKVCLNRMGIFTLLDLFWHVPRTHIDRSNLTPLDEMESDQMVQIQGKVTQTRTSTSRRGMNVFSAVIDTGQGSITAIWFNQPYLKTIIKADRELYLSGKIKPGARRPEIHVYEYDILSSDNSEWNLTPVYNLTEGINQKNMRQLISHTLDEYLADYPEILDDTLLNKYNLCSMQSALKNIHFPLDQQLFLQARKRMAFEELLLFQLGLRLEEDSKQANAVIHEEKNELVKLVGDNLPFRLTAAQQKVLHHIYADMESARVMNRLLQGDVGSGKTIIAVLALVKAVASGFQGAIMAPTEILAQQHYKTLQNILAVTDIQIGLLTGSTGIKERETLLTAIASGEINIFIGTHALFQDQVIFYNLGLVVIDEQHRFGVRQRTQLVSKGQNPDVLVMTATPIPRTLALTIYGNLQVSIIDEMPPGRRTIKTRYLNYKFKNDTYRFVRNQVELGHQAYIVCPLVEESEKQDLQAATSLYDELRTSVFADKVVGLIHGRLKPAEKEAVMQEFIAGQIQILVSTTVIEVGIDVANASVMVIEQAERFGISQLHQLRGRVGRGNHQSYCILLAEPKTDEARKRLQAMEQTNDGFELAQMDLLIRGPGDFWGVRQHGLDQLKVASLIEDYEIIEQAQECASENKWPIEKIKPYFEARFNHHTDYLRN
ncbi:MAG: ATP-dependent DNA helicase RecG [Syntrophomonadaceae bacterium]|nr:ATP-dependent DNA helicase RecG [Syntrophomonadaceae bacterium]